MDDLSVFIYNDDVIKTDNGFIPLSVGDFVFLYDTSYVIVSKQYTSKNKVLQFYLNLR